MKVRRNITMNTVEIGWDRVYVSPMAKQKLTSIFFSQYVFKSDTRWRSLLKHCARGR